jgi:hypothetical protein
VISLCPELALSAGHVYTVVGRRVVGVTTILRLEKLMDDRYFSPESAQRGTAVHAAVEQDDCGTLDEAFLDPRILPYLEGWRRFRAEHRYEPLHSEIRMFSPTLDLAGTADSVGTMTGVKGLAMVDVKSGAPSPATSLQTGVYASMYHEGTGQIIAARFAVQVSDDGTYRLHRYKDTNDIFTFRAALQLHRWRALNLPAFAEHLESEAA